MSWCATWLYCFASHSTGARLSCLSISQTSHTQEYADTGVSVSVLANQVLCRQASKHEHGDPNSAGNAL